MKTLFFPGFLLSNSVVRFHSSVKNGHCASLQGCGLPVTQEDGNMALEHTDLRKPRPREGKVGVRLGAFGQSLVAFLPVSKRGGGHLLCRALGVVQSPE